MSSFCDDTSQFGAYERIVESQALHGSEELYVKVLEWPADPRLPTMTRYHVRSITVLELYRRPEPRLRVIFAPLDEPMPHTRNILMELFQRYSVPPSFLTERIQSVTHSFGVRKNEDNHHCAWFHLLCKNINVQRDADDRWYIEDPRGYANALSQGDLTWIRGGFLLRWEPYNRPDPCVTLICFGASAALQQRFERLASHSDWQDAVRDPYNLFVIILSEWFLQMDGLVWNLLAVFRTIEMETFNSANATTKVDQQDFVGLHNVSKHIIFLKEGADAVILVLRKIRLSHQKLSDDVTPDVRAVMDGTQELLSYSEEQFQSIKLRLAGLERRMQNVINLAFNLVTQRDSRVMKQDSDSMKTVAALTLFFLPLSTTATIFGSQFFSFGDDARGPRFRMSRKFWLFWVIALPVTVVVILCWYLYHRHRKDIEKLYRRTTRNLFGLCCT